MSEQKRKETFNPKVVFEMGDPKEIVSWENHSIYGERSCMIACAISQVELNFSITILIDLDIEKFFVKVFKLNGVRFDVTRPELRLFTTEIEDQYDIKDKTFLDLKREFIYKLRYFINNHKQVLENELSSIKDSKIGIEKQLSEFNALDI